MGEYINLLVKVIFLIVTLVGVIVISVTVVEMTDDFARSMKFLFGKSEDI